MKLYEIANEYRQAFDKLAEMELSPEVIADSLAVIGGKFEDKAKATVAYIKELDIESVAIKGESDRLAFRAKEHQKKIDKYERYLIKHMQETNIKNVIDPIHPVAIKNNPPKLIIDDIDLLKKHLHDNEGFWEIIPPVVERKVLINAKVKQALMAQASKTKEELKDDERIQGAHLEQGVRLDFS